MFEFTVLLVIVMAAFLAICILLHGILERILRHEDYTDYQGG